ncbi:MAG: aminopeptidase P family protein [Ignavibacteriae bacterium]|nr:aminopeptidase P family protein [Ignavibacteriota bacterium]
MKTRFYISAILLIAIAYSILLSQSPYDSLKYNYPYKDGISFEKYKERRLKLSKYMSARAIGIIFSSSFYSPIGNFYQPNLINSNMFYLTGMPDQKSVLLIIPGDYEYNGVKCNDLIFLENQSSKNTMWYGRKVNLYDAEGIYGFKKALYLQKLESIFDELLILRDTLYIAEFPLITTEGIVQGELSDVKIDFISKLKQKNPRLIVKNGITGLKLMRESKDEDEIRLIKKAIDITVQSFKKVINSAKTGVTEYQMKALMEYTFNKLGADGTGYPSIVTSGKNSVFLHQTINRDTTKDGDLVIMDCGARYEGYTADVTRTFPINGKFTKEQKKIYNIVLEAADSAISVCYKDNSYLNPHVKATSVIQRGLMELGIISNPNDFINYFSHGTSHFIGLDVHDAGTSIILKAGNVLTIEPGIYIPEGSNCDPKWWNICVRIEDNVLITDGEPLVLTKDLPREAGDIENMVGDE